MLATEELQMCIVRILVNHGVNINAEDNDGNTSTHIALEKDEEHTDVAEARLDLHKVSRLIAT